MRLERPWHRIRSRWRREPQTTHGIPVDVGDLAAIAYPDGSFDAITARHVLEHVQEPSAFSPNAGDPVAGGRLVVVTPNVDSLGHRHFAERWRGLEQPRHLFLYRNTCSRPVRPIGVEPGEVFTSAQGAITSCAPAGPRRGAWRRAIDYLAIWRLQFAGGWPPRGWGGTSVRNWSQWRSRRRVEMPTVAARVRA
jgi:hypothetical protein